MSQESLSIDLSRLFWIHPEKFPVYAAVAKVRMAKKDNIGMSTGAKILCSLSHIPKSCDIYYAAKCFHIFAACFYCGFVSLFQLHAKAAHTLKTNNCVCVCLASHQQCYCRGFGQQILMMMITVHTVLQMATRGQPRRRRGTTFIHLSNCHLALPHSETVQRPAHFQE